MSAVSDRVGQLWREATAQTIDVDLQTAQDLVRQHPEDHDAATYLEGLVMLAEALKPLEPHR
jgi:hypothetical protein